MTWSVLWHLAMDGSIQVTVGMKIVAAYHLARPTAILAITALVVQETPMEVVCPVTTKNHQTLITTPKEV
jgi:hypothetical protein